ncbi:PREDICTED: uncharacterized protein LOC104809242 isoform X2 [Tarenaya hassleriana]|uniref:uncharacterized protein LOC104809242 isoform X1 n=1 Tax=Tarenaya hassleriana TaxID=28532 RepID=UPI00053C927C|nr:PREDICTED: uncharacterized protein LOC104809242 isoform X1 [Tarenaya hassleriana]XP_010533449.1 PREDICTED: uncharacterized protein LOC104809242 isoform X2 [Tarenaya hassleriana]
MPNQPDDDSDGIISSLIEELNLRLRFGEVEENVILSPDSHVLGYNGVGNGSDGGSVVIHSSDEEEGDDGPKELGGNDSYVSHSEDDIYFSDSAEVGSYMNGDVFGEEHYETGSYEGDRGLEYLGGGDHMIHSGGAVYFSDSEESGDSMGRDDYREEFHGSDSSEGERWVETFLLLNVFGDSAGKVYRNL